MAVQRMDHELQQLLDFRLEAARFLARPRRRRRSSSSSPSSSCWFRRSYAMSRSGMSKIAGNCEPSAVAPPCALRTMRRHADAPRIRASIIIDPVKASRATVKVTASEGGGSLGEVRTGKPWAPIVRSGMNANEALAGVWKLGQLPPDALRHAMLSGADPVLPSSFAVGTAAQVSIAAAALAACELGHARGQIRQDVHVDMLHAALECVGWFSVDGRVPEVWDKFSGLYRCADGWVRVHANFAHHRDGALRLLGLPPETAQRADAERVLQAWRALDFEQAAADHGLVVAALRRFDEWDAHPQGQVVAAQPLLTFERIGDAPPTPLPRLQPSQRPLSGLRVLDLTRILAGPVCGRTLAAYGADVMLVNAPHLPNIESIATTSRGKLSAHVDLRTEKGRRDLNELLASTHVFVQGYRPGGLDALGYGPRALAQRKLGLVYVSLSAYGARGSVARAPRIRFVGPDGDGLQSR